MRVDLLRPEVVELAPPNLEYGVLYISPKYQTALHLCCCGCGQQVVTPLSPAEWRLQLVGGKATLKPSIGNWSMPCKSHYWIRDNRVVWAGQISQRQIDSVYKRDKADLEAMHRAMARNKTNAQGLVPAWLKKLIRKMIGN